MKDSEKREQRLDMLVQAGFTRAEAQMVDDLAYHAANECIKTLVRVCNTALDDEMKIVCRISAMQFVAGAIEGGMRNAMEMMLRESKGMESSTANDR